MTATQRHPACPWKFSTGFFHLQRVEYREYRFKERFTNDEAGIKADTRLVPCLMRRGCVSTLEMVFSVGRYISEIINVNSLVNSIFPNRRMRQQSINFSSKLLFQRIQIYLFVQRKEFLLSFIKIYSIVPEIDCSIYKKRKEKIEEARQGNREF